MKNDGTYVGSEHLDLRKTQGLFRKGDRAQIFVQDVIEKYPRLPGGNLHFIEDRLGNFAMGRSMMQVMMLLASFNTLVSWLIYCRDPDRNITHLHPSHVKSVMRSQGLLVPKGGDKKKITLKFVTDTVPGWKNDLNRNGKPQPWCFDRADGFCVAKAGFVRSPLNQHGPGQEDHERSPVLGTREAQEG